MTPEELRRGVIRRAAQILATNAVAGLMLFAAAGTVRWLGAWLYLLASVLLVVANGIYVIPRNPEVVVERGRPHEGTRSFDKVLLALCTLLLMATYLVAGLDARRFGWAPLDPIWAAPGFALMALGMIPTGGAMAHNRNLEPTVRIQTERGHRVATTGPYRFVRHPMYLGMILGLAGMPLMLGSAWSAVPTVAQILCIVVRTALEDDTLHRDLPGYPEYAARTRFRLLPRVW
jgi:protein-S-isoprenylcysteine O-methyltransferase Ste14